MKTIEEFIEEFDLAKKEVDSLFKNHNSYVLEYSNGKNVHTLGTCQRLCDNQYKIVINRKFAEVSNIETVHNVIVHEILHSLPNCMNHGKEWKNAANKYNRKYNTNISRTTPTECLGDYSEVIKSTNIYEVKCCNCGKVFGRSRMSDLIKNTSSYHCKCGGKLTRIK